MSQRDRGVVGHPALGLLLRLKLRAYARSMRRRLSTPSGLVFGAIGLLFMGLWLASFALRGPIDPFRSSLDGAQLELVARATLALLALMVVFASFTHRGLYLPQAEIERLLSAPISRSDLVRYRLLSNVGRSLLFGLVTSLVVAPRMPRYALAFSATFVAMMTLPMLGQAAALVFGDAENRLGRLAGRAPRGAIRLVTFLGFWAVLMVIVFGDELFESTRAGLGEPGASPIGRLTGAWRGLLAHPVLRWATLPFAPWAKAIAAPDTAAFVPWFAVSLVLLLLAFELTARVPIDFRELSLETSADVARRLARLRSGHGAVGAGGVSARALGWKVPWFFGRGPFGAVAWLKCCSIARKSRGTLVFAVLVIAFATFAGVVLFPDPVGGAIFIALLATLYLGSGLRFDFRADLDLMEIVKAWPLRPWRVFLATILPEVVLLSVLIEVALAIRGGLLAWRWELAAAEVFSPAVLLVLASAPFVCLLWMALDNAVFLLLPVRFVPGHGSAMHHAGRTMVLLFLRMVLFAVFAAATGGAAFVASWGAAELGWSGSAGLAAAALAGLAAALVAIGGLIGFGAWALARYDIAREKALAG